MATSQHLLRAVTSHNCRACPVPSGVYVNGGLLCATGVELPHGSHVPWKQSAKEPKAVLKFCSSISIFSSSPNQWPRFRISASGAWPREEQVDMAILIVERRMADSDLSSDARSHPWQRLGYQS